MKSLIAPLLALVVVTALSAIGVTAAETKEVTLKGTLICAKCTLHETDACQNVLVVKDGDKETKYYMAKNKLAEDHEVCSNKVENAQVTGTVEEKDGKMIITATKIVD